MEHLITGAAGALGRTLASRLTAEGHGVRAIAGPHDDATVVEAVRALGVRWVSGEARDEASLDEALRGVDVVFHCAQVGPNADRRTAEQVNLVQTENVLSAARRAGVRRFVLRSSERVTRGPAVRSHVDEELPGPPVYVDASAEALALAEDLVLAAGDAGFGTAAIRPGMMWGPFDDETLPDIVAKARAGRWKWIEGGRAFVPTAHLASVADAMVRAASAEAPWGRAYYVTDDERVTAREFATRLAKAAGVSLAGAANVPYAWAAASAWLGARGFGDAAWSSVAVSRWGRTAIFNVQRARKELSWVPSVTVDEGMRTLAAG